MHQKMSTLNEAMQIADIDGNDKLMTQNTATTLYTIGIIITAQLTTSMKLDYINARKLD